MLHAFLLRNGHFSPRRYRHYSISENVLQRNRDFIFSIFGFFSLPLFPKIFTSDFLRSKNARRVPPNERFLRRVIYFFFRPQSQRRVVPSLRFSARLPSVFLFPKVCFSRAFVPLSRAAPRFYAPFLLSRPLRFLTPLRLYSSFLENCRFSFHAFSFLSRLFSLFSKLFFRAFSRLVLLSGPFFPYASFHFIFSSVFFFIFSSVFFPTSRDFFIRRNPALF